VVKLTIFLHDVNHGETDDDDLKHHLIGQTGHVIKKARYNK